MNIKIEIDEADLKQLILDEIKRRTGQDAATDLHKVVIETKSKQNFKSEWEVAAFRAIYVATI